MKSLIRSFLSIFVINCFFYSGVAKALEDFEILREIIELADDESWQKVDIA